MDVQQLHGPVARLLTALQAPKAKGVGAQLITREIRESIEELLGAIGPLGEVKDLYLAGALRRAGGVRKHAAAASGCSATPFKRYQEREQKVVKKVRNLPVPKVPKRAEAAS